MNDLPSYGIFTQNLLMVHTHFTGELSQAYLKRALLLFDRLVFIPIGLGDMGGSDELISKRRWLNRCSGCNDAPVLDTLEKLVLLDRDMVEDVETFRASLWEPDANDLWTGTQSDKFISFSSELVDKDDGVDDKLEMKKFIIGGIDFDYRLFRIINRDFEECTALLTEIHEKAVLATYGDRHSNPDTIIRQIGDLNTFDFAALNWQDIFRLRESGFVTDFRKKVAEWALSFRTADNADDFQNSIANMMEDAKFELIGKVVPNMRQTILGGIGGNLPSPIGVNPISLFSSLKNTVEQHRLKKEFGWLFFIQRCRKETANQRVQWTSAKKSCW